jgi:hypothetical protein
MGFVLTVEARLREELRNSMLSSYGSWPTPCPAGWARTICFDCRSGCAPLPTNVQRFTRRGAARERGGPLPSIDVADALLDERRELTGWISEPVRA